MAKERQVTYYLYQMPEHARYGKGRDDGKEHNKHTLFSTGRTGSGTDNTQISAVSLSLFCRPHEGETVA